MRTLTFILTLPFLVNAQSLSIGFLGGAPFEDVVKSTNTSGIASVAKSANFTLGPALRVNLPRSLRLEVDALYRPYSFGLTIPGLGTIVPKVLDVAAKQWSFPVLAQYRFGTPVVKPFIEGGLSFDHLSGLSSAIKGAITSGPGQFLHQDNASIVLGAGIDVKVPLAKISGEIRFTRPTVSNFLNISNLNQAEVLFGIHF